jgi:hypothetical protein
MTGGWVGSNSTTGASVGSLPGDMGLLQASATINKIENNPKNFLCTLISLSFTEFQFLQLYENDGWRTSPDVPIGIGIGCPIYRLRP